LGRLIECSKSKYSNISEYGYIIQCAKHLRLIDKPEFKSALENKDQIIQFHKECESFLSCIHFDLKHLEIKDEFLTIMRTLNESFTNPQIKLTKMELEFLKKFQLPLNHQVVKLFQITNAKLNSYLESHHEDQNLVKLKKVFEMKLNRSSNDFQLRNPNEKFHEFIKKYSSQDISKLNHEELKILFQKFELFVDVKDFHTSKNTFEELKKLIQSNEKIISYLDLLEFKKLKNLFSKGIIDELVRFDSYRNLLNKAFDLFSSNEEINQMDLDESEKIFSKAQELDLGSNESFKIFTNHLERIKTRNSIEILIQSKEIQKIGELLKNQKHLFTFNEFELYSAVHSNLVHSQEKWKILKNFIFIKENVLTLFIVLKHKKPIIYESLIASNTKDQNILVKELQNVTQMIVEYFMKMNDNGVDLNMIGDELKYPYVKYLIRDRFHNVMKLIFENGFEGASNWWTKSNHFWNFIEACANETKNSFKIIGDIELNNVVTTVNEISSKINLNNNEFKFISFLCHSLKFFHFLFKILVLVSWKDF
jgi:hypothetical protein